MDSAKSHDEPLALQILRWMQEASNEEEFLAEIVIGVAQMTGATSCDIFYRDGQDGLILRASNLTPEMNYRFRLGRGKGISTQVLETGAPVYAGENAELHPLYAHVPGTPAGDCQALAILPLRLENESAMGVISIKWEEKTPFTKSLRTRLETVARALVTGIQAFNHTYSIGAQMNRLGALSEVTRTLSSSPYLEEILQFLVNLTAQQFHYTVCTVRLLDESRGELVLRATQSMAKAYQRKRAIKLGESFAGKAIAQNKTMIVKDVQSEAEYIGHDLAAEQGLRSMVCVPLMIQDRVVGVLSCYTSEIHVFTEEEVTALETLASQAALAIENAKLQVRDTLMQEMHHRVKNNLQQVASLMRLQLRHGEYKSLEEALNDTLARILAIASVHDLLSREDLDHVGIRSIAESLVQHQAASFIDPEKKIKFEVRGDDVTLNMTQATQVALVANELVLNAVEHGFETFKEGEVHINIEEEQGEVSLWVSNNGDQIPPNFDMATSAHLGLQLVSNLAKSLGGTFKLTNIFGWTVAEVKFARLSGE